MFFDAVSTFSPTNEKEDTLELKDLLQNYEQHPNLLRVKEAISDGNVFLKKLLASGSSLFAAAFYMQSSSSQLIVLPDRELAAYFYNDLLNLLGEETVLFFPSSYKRSIQYQKIDSASISLRTEVLEKLTQNRNFIVVSYPAALIEKVISNEGLQDSTLNIKVGENIAVEDITDFLQEFGFQPVDFVYEPGQYSVRGSIVDIYSFAGDFPYRLDFFGNEIDSIRSFDPVSQLSKARFEEISIVANIQGKLTESDRVSFFSFFDENSTLWAKDLQLSVAEIEDTYEKSRNTEVYISTDEKADDNTIAAKEIMLSPDELRDDLAKFRVVEFGHKAYFTDSVVVDFKTTVQPNFNKNFKLLTEHLLVYQTRGYQNYILSDNENQFRRFKEIFEATISEVDVEELQGVLVEFTAVQPALHEGFVDDDLQIGVFTDHQIFERYHKFKLKTRTQRTAKEALTLKEINELQPGDYIVHTDYGIGRFGGLQKVEVNGKMQESIRLVYKDGDVVFANIHSLHRISKYKGKDGEPPRIHKLGTAAWNKAKAKAKSRIKDIAKDLIALYAKRLQEKGFAFSADTYLQQELEASFIYEDTPDQVKATQAFKADMESVQPMDRLVCGDVGFGKTEIAIRAAFKAATDGKQIAILVPTTILALQHFRTFEKRLADFPVTVGYISRLKTSKQQRETLKALEEGKIDIIIGTHRLVGKDIKFKDLGLLVIDEEQKFGVSVKEKLKQMKVNVDTLTLTATPIPRTMQFSLMGARDLSVINTPPPNRFPVSTEMHSFNEDIIREAVSYEIERGGQVFFINNRIHNIHEIQDMLHRIVPNVRTVVAHGQMEGPKLEKIMLSFIEGDYDVLIATSIIESGLDIPNANTIIVNDAHNFGLSDLHQLRGRVGRTNRKAFCYLLAPPVTVQTPEARRRLKAIEDFSELGSGFQIALQDLDIRGAGNLLGGEQSGFIADIGYENYQRILNEAIQELKENEFKEIFESEKSQRNDSLNMQFVNDCVVETDFELLFPENYIESTAERIKLYRQLDNVETEEVLSKFEEDLRDRFGKIPHESLQLFDVVRMRWIAVKLGIEKIVLKGQKLILYFVSNQSSSFYQSPIFSGVLTYLQANPKGCKMKEAKDKLTLTVSGVKDVKTAIEHLGLMLGVVVE